MSVVWPAPGEHLLYPISPGYLKRPVCPVAFDDTEWALYYRLAQGITRLAQDPNWKAIMKGATQVSDATRQALMDLLAGLAPEQRLAGLAPEQRLAGLAPEQRLAGLTEADQIVALPDAALRALPAEYLATLPADAQQRIRARLGR
jgi:hypothetical protein